MLLLTLCAVCLLLVVTCNRFIDSQFPTAPLPNVGEAPTDVRLLLDNQTVRLQWSILNPSMFSKYRIYYSTTDTIPTILLDSSTTVQITLTNLNMNTIYAFRIVPVLVSGLEGQPSAVVIARVSLMSIGINGGAEYTRSRAVQVVITAPSGASDVILSEDSLFGDAEYESYSPQMSFTLSDGDGTKTVYARIQFDDGVQSLSLLSDTIVLDTRAHIDSVYFRPLSSSFAPGDTITFGMNAGETGGQARVSFNGSGNINLYDDGSGVDATAGDGIYLGTYVVPINANLLDGTVSGAFTDQAGNSAPAALATSLLNINTPPTAVHLVGYLDGDSARFNWTVSGDADFESYRVYRSSSSSVDTTSTLIHYQSGSGTTTYAYYLGGGASYYFRVFVFDRHGAAAGSNTVRISNP